MDVRFRFSSRYCHSLDEKGRLALPGKLREELQKSEYPEEVTLCPAPDCPVAVYPLEIWDQVLADIEHIEDFNERRAAKRYFGGESEQVKIDKNGRLLIPARFRNILGQDKEIMITGAITRIELWPAETAEQEAQRDKEVVMNKYHEWNLPL